jgi:tetratricopeptide (TPR) repeat protein
MRKSVLAISVVVAATALAAPAVHGQEYKPPARAASPSTPAEDAILREGAQLHDGGKYDEAIQKYQEVLEKSPGNMTALYELAFSYSAKNDLARSLEAARRGTEYKSEQLPLFYDLIGSSLDSMGEPQKAIAAYRKGIELVPDAANLYYNMAVTYYESLKQPEEARRALERAADIDPASADTELLLGQLFNQGGYRTPAFFALSRFLVLQPAGPGSLQGYGVWRAVLRAGMDPLRTGNTPDASMRMPAAPPARTDEGNFADLDRLVASSHVAVQEAMDQGTSEIDALVAQVDTLLTAIEKRQPGAERSSFTWTHYAPYFIALKKNNFVAPFVYWVSQRAPVPGVREWLDSHQDDVRQFVRWTQQYASRGKA